MANEYLVNSDDLVSVADAIRSKGETTEQLVFPGGFIAAIETMETGKTGATLTVTTTSEGITVTVAKGELSYTKTTGADGTAVFSGLETGTWTITISDGSQTATGTVDIDADYAAELTFFEATINVTYPAGLVCTATDGVTTLTAPDTSGTWACVVPNAGTWTVTLDNGFSESVEITQDRETHTIDKWYLYNSGDERTTLTGGWWKNTNYAWSSVVERPNTGTVSFNANSIYCKPNDTTSAFASTKNKISLSDFSTLKAILTVVNRYDLLLTAQSSGYLDGNTHKYEIVSSENQEYSLDVGGLQEAYVVVGTHGASTRNVTIHKVWLE